MNATLSLQPSGCVVWIVVENESLEFRRFLWYGAEPGKPLPDISRLRSAKHTRANTEGVKAFRANTKIIPRSKFTTLADMAELVRALFGG